MTSMWDRVSKALEVDFYRVEPVPPGFIRLDSNENFFLPEEFVSEVMAEVSKVDPRLYPRGLYEPLIDGISEYLSVDGSCIVLGCGGDQMLSVVYNVFLAGGLEVLTVEPTYDMYRIVCSAYGLTYVPVPLKGDFSLDVDGILEKVSEKVGLIILCSPNNPTGNSFTEKDIRQVVEESKTPVLLDEAYAEYSGKTLVGLVGEYENLMVMRTFSKAFGLAGMRVAYLIADERVAEALRRIQLPYPIPSTSAVAASLMLQRRREVFEAVRRLVEERSLLLEALKGLDGVRPYDSETNFLLTKVPGNSKTIRERLRERKVLVRDVGKILDVGYCIRVTVGLPWMNRRLVEALSEVLEGLEA